MTSYGPMFSKNTLNCSRGPGDVDCCFYTSKEGSRVMYLKKIILLIPSISVVTVIKVQEGKNEIEIWMRYNIVAMLSHCKFYKTKGYHNRKAQHAEVQNVYDDNGL